MARYQNIYTEEIFEDETDARDNVTEKLTWDDIEDYFYDNMSFHDLFTRVREAMPDTFFETFENEFCDAENDYFERNYKKIEE